MKYRLLGRTGLRVSTVGMGCDGFSKKSRYEVAQLTDAALNTGINLFDLYSPDPWIRRHLGEALRRYPRERYVIQGHLCTSWYNGQYYRTRRLDRISGMFEELLGLLELPYVDIGMINCVDDLKDYQAVMAGEIFDYARALQKQGRIRWIGLSTHSPEVVREAALSGQIDTVMFSVNPVYDRLAPGETDAPGRPSALDKEADRERPYEGIDPAREEVYRLCQAKGMALTAMEPFAGGILLDGNGSPFGQAMTPAQCLRYALDRPAVASVIGGMASAEEIAAVAAYDACSPAESDYSAVLAQAPGSRFAGQCFYCGHCLPCPVGIPIAAVNKYLDVAECPESWKCYENPECGGTPRCDGHPELPAGAPAVPRTVRDQYAFLPVHAQACIGCGQCESRCPFGVPVREKMRRAVEVFGRY